MIVLYEVIDVVATEFDVPPHLLAASTDLTDELGADSLDILWLVTQLENRFDMKIDDSEIDQLDTLGAVAELTQEALRRSATPRGR